jgi:hypothetical protein
MRSLLSTVFSSVMLLVSMAPESFVYAAETAAAGGSGSGQVVSENTCNYEDILKKFESQGKYSADNGLGFLGLNQWGSKALEQMGYLKPGSGKSDQATYNPANWTGKDGVWNADDFKGNTAVQDALKKAYSDQQIKEVGSIGSGAIGSSLSQSGCGGLTEGGLRMGLNLIGSGGMQDYIKADGFCGAAGSTAPNGYVLKNKTQDKSGTCASKWVCAGNTCSVITTDMNKKTCSVVMPMIEAISCSNFTGQSLALCNQAKPYLMTRAECADAEKMSEAAKKGPNEEKCKNQTFGPGTGSWSYVLACSYASSAVADQDGEKNPQAGPVSDPACMEKLKGMGVQFDTLGSVQNGSYGGTTCTIENAVAVTSGSIPYSARMTMTCDMAVALEQFAQKAKGLGVTSFYGAGSTRPCGPMRDKTGNKPGTITEHSLGRAVDIPGVVVGGRKISMGAFVNQPGTPDGAITKQLKDIACSTFRGVLSPAYVGYVGVYVHFHVEWGRANGMCH